VPSSEEIFRNAMALPPDARAELTERLVESLAQDISPEISSAQLAEVRRRIAQVESGEVELVPGDEVLARVRNLLRQLVPSAERREIKKPGATPQVKNHERIC